jgi:D-alanyl-lipoteichoic acid acyltransferase DltB (MBOAT superfamily)
LVFNSLTFLLFFAGVFALHRLTPGAAGKKRLLLVASYLFYGAWSPPYVLLLFFSTLADWWLARLIGRTADQRRRRGLLVASLACNLGLLGYFKYGGFLLENFAALLMAGGIDYRPADPGILLPIGISFYTFASLSYTIDVYRGEVRSDWKFSDYALFVSFFPHLVAGPILRARNLLPQIASPRLPDRNAVGWGLALLCFGLFCKTVMADAIFAPLVDAAYGAPEKFGAADLWIAVLAFSGQIYYDFNGYSLCAIGLALCFGYAFPDNFRQPYAALGFSDFWRRWHISLSSWLRDYLYVPLGGNRQGEWRRQRNLMLTMLLGGLWHGASWLFVLWGALHGAFLVAERYVQKRVPSGFVPTRDLRLALQLLTFLLVTLAWIPFRAVTPDQAWEVFAGLWSARPAAVDNAGLLALAAMVATVAWQLVHRERSLEASVAAWGRFWQYAAVTGCLVAMFLYSGGDQRAFIYFQF